MNCKGDECNYLNSMWSECGSTCAVGYQYKQIRSNVFKRRKCDRGVKCKGWSEWSEWSRCNGNRSKTRYCFDQDCEGESKITILCDPNNSTNNDYDLLRNERDTGFGLRTLLVSCLLSFLAGSVLSLAVIYVPKSKRYFRREGTKNLSLRSVSSPLIRADKNTYVSTVNGAGRRSPDLTFKTDQRSNRSLKTDTISNYSRSSLSSNSIRTKFKSPLTKEDQF